MQLITAIPTAAADGVSKAGGMVQNNDSADSAAAAPMLMSATESARCPWAGPNNKKQVALTSKVRLTCQRRSRRLSELRASRYMPNSASR
ncbi:hypothetical protein D9M73_277550 [compost metagenome]